MMLSSKLVKSLNEQVNIEMWSANMYLSASVHFAAEGFDGFALWMKAQSKEELEHAYAMMDYIVRREGKVTIAEVDAVPTDWGTPQEVFDHVYRHEVHVSELIDQLVDVAAAEKDKASQDFLWGFVREQVEEESVARSISEKIKIAGTTGLLFMDAQLGKRK